ncbi:MAG: aminoacyl-tRNA hydrolase [Clostridia bacterium]|nr:aminoacyl-tRNA hydrolase [Clostridia bacterium]
MKDTLILCGLGNTGLQYQHTRHNVGFDTAAAVAERFSASLNKSHCRAHLAEIPLEDGRRLVIAQPQTLMNLSGLCVSELLNWYKAEPDHLLVVCDDIDLPCGRIRLRKSGGPGTHNGLRNIVELLGRQDFPRLRIGVGAPPDGDLISWVLGRPFIMEEQQAVKEAIARAADAVEDWIQHGLDHAMNQFNRLS